MSSMALDGAMPRSRSTDPVTSVDAGRTANLTESQAEVFGIVRARGPLADHELVELYEADALGWRLLHDHGFTPQRLRSARSELTQLGLLVLVEGEYRTTKSGRRAQVWALAEGEE